MDAPAAQGSSLVFSRGEDKLGPLPGVLACLFYLKMCVPWELRASPIGGAEKTACLSFLSKRKFPLGAARFADAHKKTPDISVEGSW